MAVIFLNINNACSASLCHSVGVSLCPSATLWGCPSVSLSLCGGVPLPTLPTLPGVDPSHVHVGAWALGCFHSLISTQTFRRALAASVDSWAETDKRSTVPLQWRN